MKVIAAVPTMWSDKCGAILELTHDELSILLHGKPYYATGGIKSGTVIDIHERYKSLVNLEGKVKDAENVGDALRAMADAVNAVVKSAKAAITPIEDKPKTEDQALTGEP